MSKAKSSKFLTPAKAAEDLGISVATLRKYSLIVEHTTKDSDYFERNSQNNRLYTSKNIEDFKQMVELGHRPKMTLDSAAKQIFPAADVEEETTEVKDEKVEELKTTISTLKAEAKKSEETIDDLKKKLADAIEEKDSLQSQFDRFREESKNKEDSVIKEKVNEQVQEEHDSSKGHWWNRFVK
ncbi:hypothetical protein M5C72_02405 [Companilactobacillus allii]|uniref:HTH merR-type domain-containing protein n=1 Tax=Companilactobacillus allii TaxID=1847728 RepID=A0A1P8Q2F2_9LACO|nr:hypothetical protein [Companilactobacillus allii]APX72015.1 hypothetical protein BTM29_05325 [Companilactobacillus allii]USQ69108.1 hypothetical protein M5C72_02405 [Companilactobacillus allii]